MGEIVEIIGEVELAFLFWVSVLLAFFLKFDLKVSDLMALLKIALTGKLLALNLIAVLYFALIIYILYRFGFWLPSQLSPTIYWFLFSGTIMLYSKRGSSSPAEFRNSALKGLVTLDVLYEFLVLDFGVGFWTMMWLIPLSFFLGMGTVQQPSNDREKKAKKFLESFAAFLGISLLIWSFYHVSSNLETFWSVVTLKLFLLPIILTASFIPFVMLQMVFMQYERVFIRLRQLIPDRWLLFCTKIKIFVAFRFRSNVLERWLHLANHHQFLTKTIIKETIQKSLYTEFREKHPTRIVADKGWAPHFAQAFLSEAGLDFGRYSEMSWGEWWAESSSVELSGPILNNRVMYFLSGNETAVTQLKLKLYIEDLDKARAAEEVWLQIIELMALKATKSKLPDSCREKIISDEDASISENIYIFNLESNQWVKGYSRSFTVSVPDHVNHE